MEAESDIFEPAPTSGRVAFLERFFAALERAGITYVVLHSYATLPHEIAGDDIGLGVAESDRAKIPALIRSVFVGRDGRGLPSFYKLMDVLVSPSIFEGLPRVVMEASAMGVPAVVTDVKGNREAVVHGCNGLLVPLGDVPALAAAVVRVLTDRQLAKHMGIKDHAMTLERFDEQTTFAMVKNEYRRLLSDKRSLSARIWSQTI